ncbi:MAG: long-chain fatty acid--CoA ligase [Fibrobacter sp.]|nr:long-chain fatty acid--CoA ligase [Fibrobacter sp.]
MEPLQFTSLAAMFFANCSRQDFGGWYKRHNGNWRLYAREKQRDTSIYLAIALNKRGFTAGESLGIIAPSSPEWIMADIAAQINHARIVPLFPNISSENFIFQCEDSDVKILLVDSIDDLDAPLQEVLPKFKLIISISKGALPENGIHWEELVEEGRTLAKQGEYYSWVDDQIQSIHPDDIFSIIYTSGSTGRPKGVELTHRNMLTQIQNILPFYHLNRKVDRALTILPVAHVFERMAVYYYILNGITVYFADSPKNVAPIMTEIHPTVMIVVPRILERLYESMTAAGDKARGPKRWLLKNAIKVAKINDPTKPATIMARIYDRLVYRKMREAVGGSFRVVVSGSSALNKTILRFLLNIRLPIYEGYGMTECCPVISTNCKDENKPGSIGKPLAHLDVKIGENNEILVKGDSVFAGYHNMPEKNAQIFTSDGFYKTGDQGFFDEDGYLNFTGRIKELLKTSTGKYVSPNPIELEISRHPVVEQALVIANDRKFASAVVWLNPEGARRLLKFSKDEFSVEKAMQSLRLREAINRHIGRVNKKLNHWEQIRKWTLIGDELTIESGLLTPTLKIRRKIAEARYAEQIEEMYKSG